MVNIEFKCDGKKLSETTPLDFGTVQAGTSSAIKTVEVSNTGDSDAQQCTMEAVEASLSNGFTVTAQIGTADETYNAQKFSNDATSDAWYNYAVLGVGKDYKMKTGGTISKDSGTDSFATKWNPPSSGSSGQKVWGNVFSCVYI
jgi:hypothetical protein